MKVLRRSTFPQGKPLCCVAYLYSIDNGATWMTEKEYLRFTHRFFEEVDYYAEVRQ